MGSVAKDRPPEIGRDPGIAGPEIEALQRLTPEKQKRGEQDENNRNTESNPGGGTLAQRERPQPERASRDEQDHAGPGKIEDDPGDHDGERDQPKDPAFATVPDVFLPARTNDDRR